MGRFTTSPPPPEDKPAGDFQKAETSSDANGKVGPASINDKSGDGNYKWASTTATDRNFESYHVNLISIGGTIGTALFVYMGSGLTQGGPASLLIAYLYFSTIIWAIACCQIEMVTQWPTDAAFSRFASRYVDEAFGFATGFNFFLSQQALVIFEVVAFGLVLGYWENATVVPDAVYITMVIISFALLNGWTSKFFGNAELCFAAGKIILIVGLLLFTFITMLGGNPARDRFGFRNWETPGAFANPYPQHGEGVGRFEGFLACVINAAFTIAGPDYLSMVAGEARNPRKTMPTAFRATVYRLIFFFIGSAIAIGVLVPYNDSNLIGAISAGAPGGARSPYVIAMVNLRIPVLPAIVNALILTSVFSAGNAFTFCASRTLAQLSRDGQAPRILASRNRNGVPYLSVAVVIAISLLAYCQVSASAQVVITWLTGLVGSAQLVNWCVMSFTWIRWNNGLKKQGISRSTLHTRSSLQPFAAWWALFNSMFVLLMQGYYVFLSGYWNVENFIFAYAAPAIFVVLFVGWKVIKKTKFQRGFTVDVTSFVNDAEFDAQSYPDLTPKGIRGLGVRVMRAVF